MRARACVCVCAFVCVCAREKVAYSYMFVKVVSLPLFALYTYVYRRGGCGACVLATHYFQRFLHVSNGCAQQAQQPALYVYAYIRHTYTYMYAHTCAEARVHTICNSSCILSIHSRISSSLPACARPPEFQMDARGGLYFRFVSLNPNPEP